MAPQKITKYPYRKTVRLSEETNRLIEAEAIKSNKNTSDLIRFAVECFIYNKKCTAKSMLNSKKRFII